MTDSGEGKSLYTWFAANVIFPSHERVKRLRTVQVRKWLESTQWQSREELELLQLTRLQQLLRHAEAHVPYYRDLLRKQGLRAEDVRSAKDLGRIPLLTKAIIRANCGFFKSERARGLQTFKTGGSSGEPLSFLIGRERISHDVAAKWRATRWWNVDIGDPEIVVWGSPVELNAQDRLRSLRDRLLRTELLPAFEMSESSLEAFTKRIRARRPAMLFGYPSSLSLIARYAERRGLVMNDLGIRVAFVTSERLYDHQREQIARTFGCRVANGYGGRDAGFVAHECPAGGMHITAEDILVEIIDPGGTPVAAGVAGEIVITHLSTRDFPFIRYRTGDVGVMADHQCACGRSLPLLQEIQGRHTDFLVAADGTVMHGLAVIYPLREVDGIDAFKVIQESNCRTRVQIVPGAGFGPGTEELIRSGLAARLGETVSIVVEVVSHIPAEKSGKHRYVISHVPL